MNYSLTKLHDFVIAGMKLDFSILAGWAGIPLVLGMLLGSGWIKTKIPYLAISAFLAVTIVYFRNQIQYATGEAQMVVPLMAFFSTIAFVSFQIGAIGIWLIRLCIWLVRLFRKRG